LAETPDDPAMRWPFNLPKEEKPETKMEHDFERMKRLAGIVEDEHPRDRMLRQAGVTPMQPLNPPAGTPLRLFNGEYVMPLNPSLEQVQSQANAPVELPKPEKKRRMVSPGDYRTPPVFEDIPEEKEAPVVKTARKPMNFHVNNNTLLAVFGSIAMALLIGGAVWLFAPHEHNATVSAVHWQYTMELQQRYTRHGSDWGSPPGAFNVSCERRQHGTEDCHPHDCNAHQVGHDCHGHDCNCHESCEDEGNGYSSCSEDCDTCYDTCYTTEYDTCYNQCPVYDDWCDYDYYQWVHVDTDITSGNDHEVHWGTRLVTDGSPTQRILTTEEYTVNFVQGEDHWTYSANTLGNFNRFNVGVVWDVKTNYAGMIWPQHVE
jgi:hypothetical protein